MGTGNLNLGGGGGECVGLGRVMFYLTFMFLLFNEITDCSTKEFKPDQFYSQINQIEIKLLYYFAWMSAY